jgi:hypothetical protein
LAFFSFLKQFYFLDDTAMTINDEAGMDYTGWKRCTRLGIMKHARDRYTLLGQE